MWQNADLVEMALKCSLENKFNSHFFIIQINNCYSSCDMKLTGTLKFQMNLPELCTKYSMTFKAALFEFQNVSEPS